MDLAAKNEIEIVEWGTTASTPAPSTPAAKMRAQSSTLAHHDGEVVRLSSDDVHALTTQCEASGERKPTLSPDRIAKQHDLTLTLDAQKRQLCQHHFVPAFPSIAAPSTA
jgi:hypothetical protein